MKMKNNKGITLITLAITIIVLIVLASISITSMVVSMDSVKYDTIQAELTVIQNAVLQRYTKYTLTNNSSILVGSEVTSLTSSDWSKLNITNTANYKELSEDDLENLGISNYKIDYIYVVNYINGNVIIKTPDPAPNGTLYNV